MDFTLNLHPKHKLQLQQSEFLFFNPEVHTEAKKAAVCVLLYPKDGKTYVGMIKRNKYPGVHSQQIGFAGGKVDLEDEHLWDTAKREMFEELGIPLTSNHLLGKLEDIYIPPSNFLVRPYIVYYTAPLNLNIDEREVDYFVEFPLEYLFDENRYSKKEIHTDDHRSLHAKILRLEGSEYIWGASFAILEDLKQQLCLV